MISVFAVVILVAIWAVVSESGVVPGYMLPTPRAVAKAFAEDLDLLVWHASVTLAEAGIGMAIGISLGFILAVLMDINNVVRQALYPIIILTQTIPTVAIAPLLLLWFSYGMLPKIILVVSISFFPIAIGLYDGFQSVDKDMIGLMKSMGAGRWMIFRHVTLPAAIDSFFAALKLSVSYSIVGAVIAEWLGGFSGLGVYMTRVKKSYRYDKMFAVIIFISVISLLLMWLVKLLHKKMTPWKRG